MKNLGSATVTVMWSAYSGIGWGTGCGRIGAMIAPAVMMGAPSPLLVFTALCLLAAASVWLLPESAGMAMADVPTADTSKAPEGIAVDDKRGPRRGLVDSIT